MLMLYWSSNRDCSLQFEVLVVEDLVDLGSCISTARSYSKSFSLYGSLTFLSNHCFEKFFFRHLSLHWTQVLGTVDFVSHVVDLALVAVAVDTRREEPFDF